MQARTHAFEKLKQLSQLELLDLETAISDMRPKWANRLEEPKQLPFSISLRWLKWLFEIHSPSKCVVGEACAYSFSQLENCNECCRFGSKFYIYFYI